MNDGMACAGNRVNEANTISGLKRTVSLKTGIAFAIIETRFFDCFAHIMEVKFQVYALSCMLISF